MEFTLSIFMERNRENIPTIPLPNPGEGGPVADLPGNNGNRPVIPLPNPGEGGPVADLPGSNDNRPTIPLPNPGEGGPVADLPGNNGNRPTIPLPNPGEGGPILNWPRRARIRFLNAAFGYPPFLVFVNNRVAVNFLSTASIFLPVIKPSLSAGSTAISIFKRLSHLRLEAPPPWRSSTGLAGWT